MNSSGTPYCTSSTTIGNTGIVVAARRRAAASASSRNCRTCFVAVARKITTSRMVRLIRIHCTGLAGGEAPHVRLSAIITASVPVLAWATHHQSGRIAGLVRDNSTAGWVVIVRSNAGERGDCVGVTTAIAE